MESQVHDHSGASREAEEVENSGKLVPERLSSSWAPAGAVAQLRGQSRQGRVGPVWSRGWACCRGLDPCQLPPQPLPPSQMVLVRHRRPEDFLYQVKGVGGGWGAQAWSRAISEGTVEPVTSYQLWCALHRRSPVITKPSTLKDKYGLRLLTPQAIPLICLDGSRETLSFS